MLGTKLIDVAVVAQLAVHDTIEPVAILFCLVPIKLTTELLSQKEAVKAQLEVIGYQELVLSVPGALSADNDLEAQEALTAINELVDHNDCVANKD